jgi:hypothetical protein
MRDNEVIDEYNGIEIRKYNRVSIYFSASDYIRILKRCENENIKIGKFLKRPLDRNYCAPCEECIENLRLVKFNSHHKKN